MDAKDDEGENEEEASTTYMNDNKTTSSAQWERKKDGGDDDEKIARISRPRRRVRVVVVVSIIDISFTYFLWGLDDVFCGRSSRKRVASERVMGKPYFKCEQYV